MSHEAGQATNWKIALRQHVRNRLGRLKYRHDGGLVRDKNHAFASYYAYLFKTMRQPPAKFKLVSRRRLDCYEQGPATWELRFKPLQPIAFEPGDMIRLVWRNRPETVEQVKRLLPDPGRSRFRVWTDGVTFRPPRLVKVDADTLLRDVLDLEVASKDLINAAGRVSASEPSHRVIVLLREHPQLADWRTLIRLQQRIRPRIYTIAQLPQDDEGGCLSIIARERPVQFAGEPQPTPGRCVGYLGSLDPGAIVESDRMRHPHRLPCAYGYTGRGLVIVTGSGIAGVLAFLRNQERPQRLWVIWGVRNTEHGTYYRDELQHQADSGGLTRFDIVESRPTSNMKGRHVQDFLNEHAAEVAAWLSDSQAWLYISGQEAMGQSAIKVLSDKIRSADNTNQGDGVMPAYDKTTTYMQWVVSTS